VTDEIAVAAGSLIERLVNQLVRSIAIAGGDRGVSDQARP